jgi:hypothetical protein
MITPIELNYEQDPHSDEMSAERHNLLMRNRSGKLYRVFHFEVSISAPRLDLGSKSRQILTLARARSIWDYQPLGPKARTLPVDSSDALDVKHVR